jgi:MYXO-CTERM domain-containing protein
VLPALGLSVALATPALAKDVTSADGPGGTYELLGRAFTLELPDCGHMVPHITEVMDEVLKKPVFVFHAHVNQDDDRCGSTDRQRTEVRGGKIGSNVAANGQTFYYQWKFRLPAGFQTSGSFTHIFQIKSDAAAPVMTLTPRGTSISIDGIVGVRGTTPLAKFIDKWVVVDLKLLFSAQGSIDMKIRDLASGEMLFNHQGAADTWQGNNSGHDIKFGIYRSLNQRGSLRDEQVRFADFCISRANDCGDGSVPPPPPNNADAGTPDAGADASTGDDAGSPGTGGAAGGSGGAGGVSGSGGQAGSAGGSGGASGTGGSSGSGGRPAATGGSRGGNGTGGSSQPPPPSSSGGGKSGGCSAAPGSAPAGATAGLGLLVFASALLLRRRRG